VGLGIGFGRSREGQNQLNKAATYPILFIEINKIGAVRGGAVVAAQQILGLVAPRRNVSPRVFASFAGAKEGSLG
jgi:hypothetical protein